MFWVTRSYSGTTASYGAVKPPEAITLISPPTAVLARSRTLAKTRLVALVARDIVLVIMSPILWSVPVSATFALSCLTLRSKILLLLHPENTSTRTPGQPAQKRRCGGEIERGAGSQQDRARRRHTGRLASVTTLPAPAARRRSAAAGSTGRGTGARTPSCPAGGSPLPPCRTAPAR